VWSLNKGVNEGPEHHSTATHYANQCLPPPFSVSTHRHFLRGGTDNAPTHESECVGGRHGHVCWGWNVAAQAADGQKKLAAKQRRLSLCDLVLRDGIWQQASIFRPTPLPCLWPRGVRGMLSGLGAFISHHVSANCSQDLGNLNLSCIAMAMAPISFVVLLTLCTHTLVGRSASWLHRGVKRELRDLCAYAMPAYGWGRLSTFPRRCRRLTQYRLAHCADKGQWNRFWIWRTALSFSQHPSVVASALLPAPHACSLYRARILQ